MSEEGNSSSNQPEAGGDAGKQDEHISLKVVAQVRFIDTFQNKFEKRILQ